MLRALVLGGAECVWDDAERALALFRPDAVFAVNNMIVDWPHRLDYACTLHPKKTTRWPGIVEAIRRRTFVHGRNRPEVWSHKPAAGVDRFTPDLRGSSGLFAVKVAMLEDFERIVLAGVPMDQRAHYHNSAGWNQFGSFTRAWEAHRRDLLPFVRSMSGWTANLLGEPTADWLGIPQTPAMPATTGA